MMKFTRQVFGVTHDWHIQVNLEKKSTHTHMRTHAYAKLAPLHAR